MDPRRLAVVCGFDPPAGSEPHLIASMHYDPALVALSILIAVFASYSALDLGNRIHTAGARGRPMWIAGAAVALGGGIWSMHFVGMLAFDMAMPVTYGLGLTALSLALAVVATGAAFAWVNRPGASTKDVMVGGPLMGVAIAGMHYLGMAAMHVPGRLTYSAPIVAASVVIAVTAATAALWITSRDNTMWQRLLAATIMGFAVAGMHYTGMAAATFTTLASDGGSAHPVGTALGQQNLALAVAGGTFVILFLGLLAGSAEQRRARRDLAASEQRFRAAAEAVGDIIWTNDPEGRMSGEQPDWQRYTGQSRDDCQGYGWSKAIHPDDLQPTLTAWRAAVDARRTAAFEHRVRRADGVYRTFSVRAVPVLDGGGQIREWVGVHEDITERRQFEAALEAARDAAEGANLAKSTFLANMSHELRTPLSAIIGYSEMMAEEIADGCTAGDLAGDIAKVETNARHLLGLINDVLDLSKVESGKMEVFAENFEIEPMLRDLAATVGSLVEKNGNTLTLDLAPNLGAMHSDLTKTRQILLNFLSNAAKFTEGGTITLSATREAGGDGPPLAVFSVSDTGIGMSDEQIGRLFQRFEQADQSTTRKFGGTGLGLSLSRALADMLGGTVTVSSVAGQGSTFTLRVPTEYLAPAGDTHVELDEGRGDLILVIDDDQDQLSLTSRFLRREGFRVRVASNGRQGLEMARQLQPRAILLDVMMPGVDGWSVLSQIKADEALSAIPVVMVTAVDQRNLAASLGAADYMMKPVDWKRFGSVMGRFRTPTNDQRGGILLVEDDPIIRAAMRSVLEDGGWRVTEAGDGEEGLKLASGSAPELAIIDLNMPVMDGFSFLSAFRGLPGCADTPVFILTGRELTVEDRRRLRGASQILNRGNMSSAEFLERLKGLAPRPER